MAIINSLELRANADGHINASIQQDGPQNVPIPQTADVEDGEQPGGVEALADGHSNASIQQEGPQNGPIPQTADGSLEGRSAFLQSVGSLRSQIQPQDIKGERSITWGISNKNQEGIPQMMRDTGRFLVCAITIINHTQWRLMTVTVYSKQGKIQTAPMNIAPWEAETFFAVNYAGIPIYSEGIASYKVEGRQVYLNIFWSGSFFDGKFLGIEVTADEPKGKPDFKRFCTLKPKMGKPEHSSASCVIGVYKKELRKRNVNVQGLPVSCIMGNDTRTQAVIDVYQASVQS